MNLGKKILGTFVNFSEEEDVVDPSKPLAPQVADGRPFIVAPLAPAQGIVASVTSMSEEQRAKFEAHFSQVFEESNDTAPSYHELINIAEAFNDLPPNVRYPKALKSFKGKLTKDVVLNTANKTLEAVRTDSAEYNAAQNEKMNQVVGVKKNLILTKQDTITKLQQQIQAEQQAIAQLQQEVDAGEAEIKTKLAGYNSLSAQLQQKIQTDINDIQAYL